VKVGPGDYVLWALLAVGVKATITEGMGFEGRGEGGISATAVCLLQRA
jgi:2C-methyl-D-erythritol 2,4-cyclodiphosphate synthase